MTAEKYKPEEVYITILNGQSRIQEFNSTNEDLNEFLKKDALEYQRLHLGITYLLCAKGTERIISYLTLAMGSLKIPDRTKFELRGRRLGEYPKEFPNQFPALLIGRLATDKGEEGKGGAKLLLDFAVKTALSVRERVGCGYLLAHAYASQDVIGWYKRAGFKTYVERIEKEETVPMYFELP